MNFFNVILWAILAIFDQSETTIAEQFFLNFYYCFLFLIWCFLKTCINRVANCVTQIFTPLRSKFYNNKKFRCHFDCWFFSMNFTFTYPRGALCRWTFLIHTNVQVVATIQNKQCTHGTHCAQCTKCIECTGTL